VRLRRRLLNAVLFPFVALGTVSAAAADKNVLVLLSKEQPEYRQVAENLRQTLAESGPSVQVRVAIPPEGLRPSELAGTDMIVTVGVQAARLAVAQHGAVPMLHTLLPRQSYLELARNGIHTHTRRRTAIYLDQPLRRQLNLIGFALPERTRVAVMLGPATTSLENELATAARDRDLSLRIQRLTKAEELVPLLSEALEDSDLLLALPDTTVFNSNTIHHLLIAAYHRRVPVVGFSRGLVEAGALLAVYSTPAQTGRQAAEIVRLALRAPARPLPSPQYTKYFAVAVNRRVAASLGLELPDENTLLNRLQNQPE